MASRSSGCPLPTRRGFTITELLVAMALIVFIMSILSEAFTAGLESFRRLKAVGDQNERLRSVCIPLREDLAAAHFDAREFIRESFLNGSADPKQAAALRIRYEAIADRARTLRPQVRAIELQTVNPVGKRILEHILKTLELIEWQAGNMVAVIRAIEDDDDDDDCGGSSGARPANAR